MKRRNKWILITIVSLSFVITFYVYLLILKIHDVNEMEKRRSVLLYEIDHQALLEACRELSQQVATGRLKPGTYLFYGSQADSETRRFPQLIRDLEPLHVLIDVDVVYVTMSVLVVYGIIAFPENLDSKIIEMYEESNRIELINGLWYFDNDFLNNPEHIKEVEELLKKRKSEKQKNSVTVEKISKNHALLKKFKPNIY